jgi:hypothetical protein
MTSKEKIVQGFIEFQLLNGRKPHSVFELTKKLKIEESVFYKSFTSIESLEQFIPYNDLERTFERVDADTDYPDFSAREKILTLYFTLFEELLKNRSYYLATYKDFRGSTNQFKHWQKFMDHLNIRIEEILQVATSKEEVKNRPYISEHYSKGFKLVFTYVFRVWLKDESTDFSTTDAAIEKSVNLSFDLMGESPLDSLIDFGKFAFKTKMF